MLPTISRRNSSAATSSPSRSSPSAFAKARLCSRESKTPSWVSSTCSSAVRTSEERCGATSYHSREEKLSRSQIPDLLIRNSSAELSLTKQIIRGSPDQFASCPASRAIPKPANDTCGRASQLAADQPGSASQFVSNRVNAYPQLVTARVATAPIILERLLPHYADCNLSHPLAPGTPKTITDDHRNRKVQTFFQLAIDLGSRMIRFFGQQQSMAATINV